MGEQAPRLNKRDLEAIWDALRHRLEGEIAPGFDGEPERPDYERALTKIEARMGVPA